MSFYDDASLVLIPSGYKSGKIYSQKPLSTDGELTFTRASHATRVNVNGYVEKARTNNILQSNQFDTTWSLTTGISVTSGQADKDGGTNAWLLKRADGSARFIKQTISQSGVQSFSVYIKAESTEWVYLFLGGTTSWAYFDLGSGSVGLTNSLIDSSIEAAGNGFYRCTITASASTSEVRIYPAQANGAVSGDSDNGVYIQDAQLEAGLVATDYIETTTAAVTVGIYNDVPRLDYPAANGCPSLLLEPQRTNLVPQSEYFGASWSESAATITTNASTSPEGAINATELSVSSNAGSAYSNDISVSSSTSYTFTFYVKKGTSTQNYLAIRDQTNAAWIDEDIQYIPAATGWTRIDHTFTTPATCTAVRLYPQRYSAGGTGTTYIYGAQLEAGSYPTSYIPTYGSTVTRVADDTKKNISALITDSDTFTFFAEYKAPSYSPGGGELLLENTSGSSQARVYLNNASTGLLRFRTDNPANNYDHNYSALGISVGDTVKIALSINNGVMKCFVDGVLKTTASAATIAFGQIHFRPVAVVDMKKALVFDSALSDADCITLTT